MSQSPSQSPSQRTTSSGKARQPLSKPGGKRGNIQNRHSFFTARKDLDAVDKAIVEIAKKKSDLSEFTSDDLFFLSISRDARQLSIGAKMPLRELILNDFIDVMEADKRN